jgi:HD-like signal output (HDOD) protein
MEMGIEDFLDGEIKSLPAIFYKLTEACEDPDSSFEDIGSIISMDAGLSARLLKIVNSPFFALSQKIDSVSHAMGIIGVKQLNDLVLSTAVADKFQGIHEDLIDMESFWRHSITCGMIARDIAKFNKNPNAEQLYLAGLIHDLGTLVICDRQPEKTREILNRCNFSREFLYEAEQEILGFNHADVGGALLKSWGMPDLLVETVLYHNDPLSAKEYRQEVGIVHIADRLTYDLQLGTGGEYFFPPINEELFSTIKISTKLFDFIKVRVMDKMDEIVGTFLAHA